MCNFVDTYAWVWFTSCKLLLQVFCKAPAPCFRLFAEAVYQPPCSFFIIHHQPRMVQEVPLQRWRLDDLCTGLVQLPEQRCLDAYSEVQRDRGPDVQSA